MKGGVQGQGNWKPLGLLARKNSPSTRWAIPTIVMNGVIVRINGLIYVY